MKGMRHLALQCTKIATHCTVNLWDLLGLHVAPHSTIYCIMGSFLPDVKVAPYCVSDFFTLCTCTAVKWDFHFMH